MSFQDESLSLTSSQALDTQHREVYNNMREALFPLKLSSALCELYKEVADQNAADTRIPPWYFWNTS